MYDIKSQMVVVLGGVKWWLEEGTCKALVMFCFLKVLITGLCSVAESLLSWVHLCFMKLLCMLYFNNFFFQKVNGHLSRSKKTNTHILNKNSLSFILLGRIRMLEACLFCKILSSNKMNQTSHKDRKREEHKSLKS